MAYDLVVTGGVVVDGTGLARRRADVGVRDGRIVDVGHLSEGVAGARVVDADGLFVAPGIIDAHTHYDPQLTFDAWATSSCYHGVTTVLAGNCGFSIAPTRERDRDFISRMFARVEGMSPVALSGVEWDFDSRLPIVIQGLGGRNKVDAPTAGWTEAEAFLGDAARRGAAIFSLLRNHPFDRAFSLESGTQLYDGVPAWAAFMFLSHDEKLARLRDTGVRDELRDAVDHPNKDASKGSTLPPPHWHVVFVDEVTEPQHEKFLKRSIKDIAAELGKAPADVLLHSAPDSDLRTVFRREDK